MRDDRERLTGSRVLPDKAPRRKITRDAFLYYSNPEKITDFAQCSSCVEMNQGEKFCAPLSKDVALDDTCGVYLKGVYDGRRRARLMTPQEAGYLAKTQVRCENCFWGGHLCGLYVMLNRILPQYFDLKEEIEPLACCNAWTP
jgi:hypothetical protein